MIFNSTVESATYITVAFCALSLFSVWRCFRQDRFLSALSGLHANTFIMIGAGPLIYTHFPIASDQYPHGEILEYFVAGSWPLLIGYFIWVAAEGILINRTEWKLLSGAKTSQQYRNFFGVLAVVGYTGCTFEFSQYGAGTIFPVMKNFVYPALFLTILNFDIRNEIGMLMPDIVLIVLMAFISFYSPWRSELIMLFIYILIAMYIRFAKFRLVFLTVGTVGLMIILPFVQYKKMHYDEFQNSPLNAVIASQSVSIEERFELIGEFVGVRLNYLRELGYVMRALEFRDLDYRYGDTYQEACYQLIPRAIWPDKPSFNELSNHVIPQQIGLVGRTDKSTSWGVNLFAEFSYNFPKWNLLWFVPVIFFLFSRLDRLNVKWFVSSQTRLLCACTLFSMTFTVVGLLNLTTFILWNFLLLKVIDSFAIQYRS